MNIIRTGRRADRRAAARGRRRRAVTRPARPAAAGLEAHGDAAVPGALHPAVAVLGVVDVVAGAPRPRQLGRLDGAAPTAGGGVGGLRARWSNSAGGGSSPSPASDTPSSRTPPSGTAARARRWAVAVSTARSVLASAAVSERVAVVKSALRTLTVTVRAARPDGDQPPVRRLRQPGDGVVHRAHRREVDVERGLGAHLLGRAARRDRPIVDALGQAVQLGADRAAQQPCRLPRVQGGQLADRLHARAGAAPPPPPGPTPHSIRTGSGARTSCWSAGSTTRRPSGFASSDAILASCLPEPAPTDAGRPVAVRTSARSAAANRSTSAEGEGELTGGFHTEYSLAEVRDVLPR